MKILTVNHLLDPVTGGGTTERVVQLTRTWTARGHECDVLTLDAGLTPARRAALVPATVTALRTINRRFFVPLPAWTTVVERVRAADLVLMMGHWTAVNLLATAAARRTGRPFVVSPAGALRVAGRSQLLKRLYNAIGGSRGLREAAAWIAVSPIELGQYAGYGVAPDRVVVIPNGVDAETFTTGDGERFRARFGVPARPFVLFVGRLAWSKGPDLLLDAFVNLSARLPDHDLVFVGTDEGMLTRLRDTARDHGLAGRVHFPGYVGGADKADAYRAASLLVIPSRYEAMSIVALEAGASGTPVLLTDGCGFDEVGAIGGGAVVPASVAGLESALTALLADASALAAMGARLQTFVRARYTWPDMAERHLEVFARVLNHRPPVGEG